MRVLYGLSLVAALIIVGCSSPSNNPTSSLTGTPTYPYPTTGLTCSATGTGSGNQISVTIYAQGGSAPYQVTSMSVNGTQAQLSGATQFAATTTVTGYLYSSVATNGTGTITMTDAYSNPASCSFALNGSGYPYYPTPTPTYNPYPGNSGACQVAFAANPISRGSQVDIFAYTSTYGGTLSSVYGPTGYGITGSLTGANSARLYFPYPGQFLITMYLSNGGSCAGYMNVN